MNWRAVTIVALVVTALALSISIVLIRGAVTTVPAEQTQAASRFEEVRRRFADPSPLVLRNAEGRLERVTRSRADGTIREFRVLVYRPGARQLLETEAPFWFVRMKSPAIHWVLRDTPVSLSDLGLTGTELERAGPGIVVDDVPPIGNWVLIWTQE